MERRRMKENESQSAFLTVSLNLPGSPTGVFPGDRIVGIPLPCPAASHLVTSCELEKYSFFGMRN